MRIALAVIAGLAALAVGASAQESPPPASLLDFLDAERTYRSNQLAYRQALANYMLALKQMRQAVGTRKLS